MRRAVLSIDVGSEGKNESVAILCLRGKDGIVYVLDIRSIGTTSLRSLYWWAKWTLLKHGYMGWLTLVMERADFFRMMYGWDIQAQEGKP